MADPVFFNRAGPFPLHELAAIAGAGIHGTDDKNSMFKDVADIDSAGKSDVSFLDNKKYTEAFTKSNAGACIVHPDYVSRAPDGMVLLVTDKPYQGYARIAQAFYPVEMFEAEISKNADIDKTAIIGDGCRVEGGAYIGAEAVVGSRVSIGHGSYIGPGVKVGDGCVVSPGVTIQYAVIGNGCIFHPGARIGQDGFGFAPGGPPEGHIKVPQLGRVIIGDMVEIGANTTIDRGAGPDTIIGDGTKIDNLV
ncbi:MAG: UDP-3-O-(3-hydroxymyristoyl)glucosamine N-acyltransferase, partial [Rhodospirillaceae bacterium]|nr:UDP-3-O-(3-hydroxymyristoyl)glucosamine N-acyltransferase [Rhodospirillaceae bacterium]